MNRQPNLVSALDGLEITNPAKSTATLEIS